MFVVSDAEKSKAEVIVTSSQSPAVCLEHSISISKEFKACSALSSLLNALYEVSCDKRGENDIQHTRPYHVNVPKT